MCLVPSRTTFAPRMAHFFIFQYHFFIPLIRSNSTVSREKIRYIIVSRQKKLILYLASSALTFKIYAHIPFLLRICCILFYSISKFTDKLHCIAMSSKCRQNFPNSTITTVKQSKADTLGTLFLSALDRCCFRQVIIVVP